MSLTLLLEQYALRYPEISGMLRALADAVSTEENQ